MFSYQIDEHLQLRLLQMEHAEGLFLQVDKNRLYMREWLPWVDMTLNAEHIKEFIRTTQEQYVTNNGFQTGIFYKGEIVGCVGLHGINWNHRKASIGYWLAAEYQGKGIMSRSCRAIIEYLFISINCFNFKGEDENLFREIKTLTENGYTKYKEEDLV